MVPKLYYIPISGPCRTVMLTAKLLEIELELEYVDLFKGEHLTPEFKKLNPAHKVPILKDGDLCLGESRCIVTYLVEQYGKDDALYPKDPKKRALVDEKLYFDATTLYDAVKNYYATIYSGNKNFDGSKLSIIQKSFEMLDEYVENSKFAVGDTLTVADIALISTVATSIAMFDFDLEPYPNVTRWYNVVKSCLPNFEEIIEENGRQYRLLSDTFRARNN